MSTSADDRTLITDFDLMRSVAAATEHRNDEIRAMLQAFITRMAAVPPSVWGGPAAARFQAVIDRWNTESVHLHRALHDIAETIRDNERALREAAQAHSARITAAGNAL